MSNGSRPCSRSWKSKGPATRARGAAPAGEKEAEDARAALATAGVTSEEKPHAFVAMPFTTAMKNVFNFGIRPPVRKSGLLCELVSEEAFTGDIVTRVLHRIRSASLVVAEVTNANGNVFLEVGYAWGAGRRVILVAQDATKLPFDVRGQRCLTTIGAPLSQKAKMKSRTPAIVAFATLLIAVNFGHARAQLPEPPSPDVAPIEHPDEPGTGRLVAGGLMGGLVGPGLGLFGGAMIEHTATTSCTDFCGLAGSLLGGVALESVGLGLGVHLHDDRRDNPVLTSLVSLVTAAASLYAIEQINERRLRGPVENGGTRGRCH